jgi:hypothetical protein
MSPYVVLPAEANSTSLPPVPGQELHQHARQLQVEVDSDAANILSPSSFLPRSIYSLYFFPSPLLVFINFCGSKKSGPLRQKPADRDHVLPQSHRLQHLF